MHIPYINANFIQENTDFPTLIQSIKNNFCDNALIVPMRHHHDFPNTEEAVDSTLLLMPAWHPQKSAGVKIVTVSPNNGKYDLPSIQGSYIYLDSHKGSVKAILEAKALTAKRTAAASALASQFLSRIDSSSMLMIGTGALSSNLIAAHTAVRPIKEVFVWGRDFTKAQAIVRQFNDSTFNIKAIQTIEEVISKVDIISCATLSSTPLVFGKYLRAGQHIDLVGAYKKNMREADDATIQTADIYLDTYQGGLKESGDIVIPIQNGILEASSIKADLFELCQGKKVGRQSDQSITLFKSVGHALEDLAAADYYFNQFTKQH